MNLKHNKFKVKPTQVKAKVEIATPDRIIFNPHNHTINDVTICTNGFYHSRNGLYAHFCYEWDEMLIDENDIEFKTCNCGKPNVRT